MCPAPVKVMCQNTASYNRILTHPLNDSPKDIDRYMSYDDESNPREELYQSFLKSLKEPATERFFDEDELVEIFDYAGDLADDYARAEVLFCGARLYPESAPLKERRALLYFDLEDAEKELKDGSAAAFIADNSDHSSLLFDIVRLEANRPADAPAALAFLMEQYPSFSDEETIRFIDLAFDLDCYDWVKEHMPELRKKANFLPSLLYEVLQEADEQGDDETVAALAEELIEAEPFSIAYWATLFRAQARLGKEDDARQTFDTAKALGADNPAALLNLADTIYSCAPYLQREAIEMMGALKKENPDDFTFTDCRCALLVQHGDPATAVAELRKYMAEHPGEIRPLKQFLLCNITDAESICDRYIVANNGQEMPAADLDETINALLMRSAMNSLAGLLKSLRKLRALNAVEFASYAEALFALGRYEETVELIGDDSLFDEITQIPFRGASHVYICVVAYMKTGREEQAREMLDKVTPFFEAYMAGAPLPVRMASRTLFTLADKVRRHPASDKLYWEYFDMLGHSKFT